MNNHTHVAINAYKLCHACASSLQLPHIYGHEALPVCRG